MKSGASTPERLVLGASCPDPSHPDAECVRTTESYFLCSNVNVALSAATAVATGCTVERLKCKGSFTLTIHNHASSSAVAHVGLTSCVDLDEYGCLVVVL